MPQYKIMIAQFPGNNVTHPDVADWVTRTVIQMHKDPRIGPDGVLSFRMASTPITMVRNKAVVMAKQAGCDYCFVGNTPIETVDGVRNIADIKIGDMVRTHTGRFCRVTNTMKRLYKQRSPLKVVRTKHGALRCTPEHPFFVERNGVTAWLKADELVSGDNALYPDVKHDDSLIFDIAFSSNGPNGDARVGSKKNGSKLGSVNVTEDLARFMGLYLAEGCATSDGICFTFNNNETDYIKLVCDMSMALFGRRPSVSSRWATNVKINVRPLGGLFKMWFGEGAKSKRIPPFVFGWSLKNRLNFIRGYIDGDGHDRADSTISFTTVSEQLVKDMAALCATCGLNVSMSLAKARTTVYCGATIKNNGAFNGWMAPYSARKMADLLDASRSGNDYLAVKITDISDAKMSCKKSADFQYVYNLEVEGDNSYVAGSCAVHNCLMVDSDMKPDIDVGEHPMAKPFWPHAFDWALEHGPCNVAAPYCGSPPREAVYVAAFQNWETEKPDACFDWELKPIPRREAALKTGFEQVGALATGLILIDMRVFQKLPPPWFDYDYADETESEMITTEDYFFTRNCGYLGFPQYVFWDAWAGHWKPKLVGRPHVLTTDHVREPFRVACTENLKDDQFLADIRNGVPQVVKAPVNPDEVKARSKKRLAKLKGVPAKRG